ncbi:MAG: DUF2157 domain-containing protein [Clostridia bacterium]|nr:DUF2157 domain-containing protein [Clostridia bacterium]
MSRKNVKWLYAEIPKLVSEGILSGDMADKLHQYYGEGDEGKGLKTALTIFGVLGTILIAAGIILILAKNWSELSRELRTVIAFLPLVAGQLLALYTYLKKKDSVGWREASSSFLMIAVGAAISLIGQTYNLPGDFDGFMLLWMLLGLPLVYLLDATLPALFYMIGITVWAGSVQSNNGDALFFWALLGLLTPYIYKKIKQNQYSNPSVFLCWSLSAVMCAAIGITLEKVLPGLWIIVYCGYFSCLYLLGELRFKYSPTIWQQPFKVVGTLGMLGVSFILTYEWPWNHIGWRNYRHTAGYNEIAGYFDYVVLAGVVLTAFYLLYAHWRKRDAYSVLWGSAVVLSLVGYTAAQYADSMAAMLLFNAYLLLLGIVTVIKGVRIKNLGVTNAGMLIITLLALLRFFDSDLGFVERGIAFILVGAGFLVSNILILKKRGEGHEK